MAKPKIELLIGMIGSGKSTYARQRAKEGALVVSHDDLTAMLHAEYRYEQGLRELYRQMESQLVACALCNDKDVVIDRTHLTRESRARWVDMARDMETPIVAVVFPIFSAHEHAMRRHSSDARGRSFEEWLQVARHHAEQDQAEPFDWRAEGFSDFKVISVPPWPAGLSEQTADYLAKQP